MVVILRLLAAVYASLFKDTCWLCPSGSVPARPHVRQHTARDSQQADAAWWRVMPVDTCALIEDAGGRRHVDVFIYHNERAAGRSSRAGIGSVSGQQLKI